MFIVETGTYPQEGVGKPDYSKEISLGQVRPGLALKYLQSLIVFGVTFSPLAPATPYSWIKLPLGAGLTSHLVDWETGDDLPYPFEVGYTYTIISIGHSLDQDHALRAYLSTPALGILLPVFVGNLGTMSSGQFFQATNVVPFSSIAFDSTARYEHEIDFVAENLGGADMEGSLTIHSIKEAVGTPALSKEKTVKCKWCGHKWVVPKETTYIKCPECGEMNIYCDFSRIRSIG